MKVSLQFFLRAAITVSLSLVAASAQSGGRFEESKRQALAYLDSNQYDRAAGKLEEIWEQDHSDISVAEDLAIAYLNGDDRRVHPEIVGKARDLMQQALHSGGHASFIVQHSHEKLGFLQGKIVTNYCSGRLSISPGRLVYVAQARGGLEIHSFDFTRDEVRVSAPDSSGAFTLKTKSKSYSMIPRTRDKEDSALIVNLIHQQLGSN